MTESCNLCFVEFRNKTQHREHVLCCKLIKDRTLADVPNDRVPNPRIMYELIKNLAAKCDRLETEVRMLKNTSTREKRKINLIDYLNETRIPTLAYKPWLKELIVQPRHVEKALENKIINGIFELVDDALADDPNLPIASFSHRRGRFYVWKDDAWEETKPGFINELFDNLAFKFLLAYTKWELSKPELNARTEEAQKYKMMYMKLLTSRDEIQYKRFSGWLFEKIKQNVKKIVEYEFE
jgi:hypothetical protein